MQLSTLASKRNLTVVVAAVVVLAALFGAVRVIKSRGGALAYPGLKTTLDVDMDAKTRTYLEERVAVDQAAIAAQEKSGAKVDLNLYMTLASDAYSLGELDTARVAIEKQLKGNGANYTAWNLYGTILEGMEDYSGAEKAYRKAIDLGGDIEEFYRDLVILWQNHFPARNNDVRALLEEAVAKHQTPWNMVELARWYAADGDCERSLAHYKVAQTLAPKNADLAAEYKEAEIKCEAK